MKLAEQNILIISPEPWDHIWVSKHHYARTLAEMGAKVVFANPPKNTWSLKQTEFPDLQVLDYPKFIPGLRKLPSFISQRIIKRKLKQIEEHCAIHFDLIWSFDNSIFFDFTLLETYNISHIVDLNQDFETEKATRTADLSIGNSNAIWTRLSNYNTSHFINHGYQLTSQTQPLRSKDTQRIKIGYAGNLDIQYLDWNILVQAFNKFPDVTFCFAGSIKDSTKLTQYPNIEYHGLLNSDDLNTFYSQMDILIICYLADDYPEQLANPHKFLEYLGTGKPIVCSYTETYAEIREVQMSSQQSEWLSNLQSTIEKHEFWDSEEMQQKRIAIANANTYQKQIERIENIIANV